MAATEAATKRRSLDDCHVDAAGSSPVHELNRNAGGVTFTRAWPESV